MQIQHNSLLDNNIKDVTTYKIKCRYSRYCLSGVAPIDTTTYKLNKMVITRKIQVYVSETDKELKKQFIHTIYDWRNLVRRAANAIVSHKFTQDNIKDFIYLKDEIKEKFYVKDILKQGKGFSEQNTTYRVVSEMLKGKVPADIYSSLNQSVSSSYKETKSDILKGDSSLRTYKNNIPIPFSSKALNLQWNEEFKRFNFSLFGIPFSTSLGRDRSNNKYIIDRCLSGEYKICGSSIKIDDKNKKMFLLLCVNMPVKEVELNEENYVSAFLSISNPIVAHFDTRIKEIGTKEEFLYRRIQIQEARKRAQINARYSVGGKGRKRKMQSVDRFEEKESNYVETKIHTYTRMLVDFAIENKCRTIYLINQEKKEDQAKENEMILRNWSYFGMKTKLEYKAKMVGIEVKEKNI